MSCVECKQPSVKPLCGECLKLYHGLMCKIVQEINDNPKEYRESKGVEG